MAFRLQIYDRVTSSGNPTEPVSDLEPLEKPPASPNPALRASSSGQLSDHALLSLRAPYGGLLRPLNLTSVPSNSRELSKRLGMMTCPASPSLQLFRMWKVEKTVDWYSLAKRRHI